MAKKYFLIGLVLLLGGCSKTDLFGYSSYNHCMVEAMRNQNSPQYPILYCKELFPEKEGE